MYHLLKLDSQVQKARLKPLKYNKLPYLLFFSIAHGVNLGAIPHRSHLATSDTDLINGQLLYCEPIWN